ncbi:MAG: UDP-N-acetylglucosamine 2-epimerase [Bacteroidota bacterium]|nr:UDP-N-acetylglucosamine 2-epimerase [Bacteroidota bacterium]
MIFQKKHLIMYVRVSGDRYELLPIVQAAIIYHKPIIHIHGGEATQGAIDEQIRHMITKAAHIHFASCEEYAQNIRKMGEESWRVFNTGALAVENMQEISSLYG